MDAGTEPDIATLALRAAYQDIVDEFCRRTDAYDVDGIVDLFTDDMVIHMHVADEVLTGKEAFRAQQHKASVLHRIEPLGHYATNVTCRRLDDDTAEGRHNALLLTHYEGRPSEVFAILDERDVLRREGGRWRIAERFSTVVGTPRQHSPDSFRQAGFES